MVSERPSELHETFSSAKKVSLPLEPCDDDDATALTKVLVCAWRGVVIEKKRGLNREGKVGARLKWEKKW